MKILAIRLKNLASLAGPFEIDFTAEPLASAGLFAITGPPAPVKALCTMLCAWRCLVPCHAWATPARRKCPMPIPIFPSATRAP